MSFFYVGEILLMKKIYKRLLLLGAILYVVFTLINQQKMLDSYQTQQVAYEEKIQEEKDKNVELLSVQENVNSTEYIEEIAREKLDMYLPNERRYIDVSK